MGLVPVGDRMVVEELTENERQMLGFPVGTSGTVQIGVVMAIAADCALSDLLKVGDRVYHRCKGPKVGADQQMVCSDCVVGYVSKEDIP